MGRIVIEPVNAPVTVEDLAELEEDLRAQFGDEHQFEAKEPLEYRGGIEPETLIRLVFDGFAGTGALVAGIALAVQTWRKRERKGGLPREIIRFEARTYDEEGRLREISTAEIERSGEK